MGFIKDRFVSLGFALKGIKAFIMGEVHAKVHLVSGTLAVLCGLCLSLSTTEWSIVILCIISVLSAEAFNTAIELLLDFVHPEHHEKVGKIKDISAGAVLFLSFGSLIIGGFVFLPKIIELIKMYSF